MRVGFLFFAVMAVMPAALAQAQPGMVEASASPSGTPSGEPVVTAPARRFGVGYARGAGLGNYGASVAMTAGKRLVPQLLVFGFHSDGERGFAIAPTLQHSFVDNRSNSPYIAAGIQYHRLWFGDASGGGFGAFANLGWELRFDPIAIQFGIGLNIKQAIVANNGLVRMEQAASFGLHWDAGIRYWF